ncbi:MAG: dockerin type I repeat-containing protein [Planctomycetota bacterium]|nr:dockerin type I repeat-containing protein [Planctomycetota bacterium]
MLHVKRTDFRRGRVVASCGLAGLAISLAAVSSFGGGGGGGGQIQLPTTAADFYTPGTQPQHKNPDFTPIFEGGQCVGCHGFYDPEDAPYETWAASMMALSARDPIWQASVAIANQDAANAGQSCIRCHSPSAFLGNRHTTGTLDEFELNDFDGVNCAFCHRMVNPELGSESAVGYLDNFPYDADPDPEVLDPLAAAGDLPAQGARTNGAYVVDHGDVRRGPFDDVPANYHGAPMHFSPFHSSSAMCGTCHDVSNINTVKLPDGTWGPDVVGTPHATGFSNDMFPEQRTYSEWLNSQFAVSGVEFLDNRFGGNHPTGVMSTCQDCHMPDQAGGGCIFFTEPPYDRPDVPQHSFAGANSWVPAAVRTQLGVEADDFGITQERVDASIARNVQMLRDASDTELSLQGSQLKVRVTNQSGHKLPTGLAEGRRMWINVKFLAGAGNLLSEHGAYDFSTGTLLDPSAKQYGARMVTSGAMADAANIPDDTDFHIALLNEVVTDNRIPPRGFTNAAYAAFGGQPVGVAYADGQFWDDTMYAIPAGATTVVVTVYHQTTTREYAEFLRDANTTTTHGQTSYDLWVQHGRSAPVDMDSVQLDLGPACQAVDLDCDGTVTGADLALLLSNWGTGGADVNGDGNTNGADLALVLSNWG